MWVLNYKSSFLDDDTLYEIYVAQYKDIRNLTTTYDQNLYMLRMIWYDKYDGDGYEEVNEGMNSKLSN